MNENAQQTRLLGLAALASDYCLAVENAAEYEMEEFVKTMLDYLPRIYWEFSDLEAEESADLDFGSYANYVEEDYYESVRRGMEMLFGAEDVFLETFEEDMKYSDTPIASSVSECLADIFQPLYNFSMTVRESEGASAVDAFRDCKENFESYWAQTLCNVLRALNNLRYGR